jgi:hypothetical protein
MLLMLNVANFTEFLAATGYAQARSFRQSEWCVSSEIDLIYACWNRFWYNEQLRRRRKIP